MNSNFTINPVKATCWKYRNKDHGIQGINDTCYGVCASFSKSDDAYNIDRKCSEACKNLVEKRKREIFGVGSCDHQVPYLPVIWNEVPRFFPYMLDKNNPEEALILCKKECEKTNLVNECVENCEVDYHAIERYDNINLEKDSKQIIKNNQEESKKTDPFSLIIMWVVLIPIILIIIVLFVLYRIYK